MKGCAAHDMGCRFAKWMNAKLSTNRPNTMTQVATATAQQLTTPTKSLSELSERSSADIFEVCRHIVELISYHFSLRNIEWLSR